MELHEACHVTRPGIRLEPPENRKFDLPEPEFPAQLIFWPSSV